MFQKFAPPERPLYQQPIAAVLSFLKSDQEQGLSVAEALERQAVYGENVLRRTNHPTRLRLLLRQFQSPLIIILLIAGIVTMISNDIQDALFIFAAVLVNALLGFYQENKAEHALGELRTYLKERCRVIRDGREQECDASELVPGDIIRVAQGDRVPADALIFYANDVYVDEAVLTGEPLPAKKDAEPLMSEATLGDRRNELFAGTLVTQGVATAVVIATDEETELGKIATIVGETREEETPLQKAVKRLSLAMSAVLVVVTIIVFGIGLAQGQSWSAMFLTAVALAVSAIPEGLPVALTVILAVGVERMAKRKGVVRKLVAAETLGSVDIIVTDKTGTLTTANMEVGQIISLAKLTEHHLLSHALLNTSVLIENPTDAPDRWRMNGRFIETALVRAAGKRGVVQVVSPDKVTVLPFNAAHKYSVSLTQFDRHHELLFMGAPDVLLERAQLSSDERSRLRTTITECAERGDLVLGVARKKFERIEDFEMAEHATITDLIFEGLITLHDPLRPGVAEALQKLTDAGITTVLATGDHAGTALTVARGVGLITGTLSATQVIEAAELRALTDDELALRVRTVRVFARVAPLDKLRILQAFQANGNVVAMTGDGVNDAPSIKQADIGIAMGSGTHVARDVSDLVLLDDNYETIAAAVEEGRRIVHTIRSVVVYLFSSVLNEMMLVGGALVFGLPLPLVALQILWINFFSDSFPAIAFAFEKNESGVIHRRARNIFEPALQWFALGVSFCTSLVLLAAYVLLIGRAYSLETIQSTLFVSLGLYTLLLAFSVRSLESPQPLRMIFANRALTGGVVVGSIFIFGALYIPGLNTLLSLTPLSVSWVGGACFITLVNLGIVEVGKRWYRSTLVKK